ncbi:MAG TPA: hypothetical protein VKB80_31145 [Kofleriaceae bacterium]|nr:hypothetical protein [Kofleriaceae bacterium]
MPEPMLQPMPGPMLDRDEIARLEAGLPRLSEWGAGLLVPFEARRLRGASVAWLNERWFLERRLDVTDAATRRRACAWLLDEFAYSVPGEGDPADACSAQVRTFAADRYGGSGMVPHGGSGRAGLSGCFQAKGVGVTPLVGDVRSWTYSHGCAWLEEALREAIYSEIAAAEFPLGAVPVIAVLDAGVNYRMPSGELGERRAIVVRPAAVRPAHLERAPMFSVAGPGAGPETGKVRRERDTIDTSDVVRVKDAIRAFSAGVAGGGAPGLRVRGLADMMARVAEQVAFGQVHRLCHGGYLTSNVTVNGELIDFGSFRAVPDWSKVFPIDNMPAFGDELLLLGAAIRSLCFFFEKYDPAGRPALSAPQMLQAVTRVLAARFDLECLRVWGVEDVEDAGLRGAVIGAMREYFAAQQRVAVSCQRGFMSIQPWIGEQLLAGETGDAGEAREAREARASDADDGAATLERRTLARIDEALAACFGPSGGGRRELSRLTAARLLKPRPGLHRENLQDWLYDLLGGQNSPDAPDPEAIARAVRTCLSSGRRHWPLLPADLAVFAQTSCGHSSALLCRTAAPRAWCLWLEGVRSGDQVRLFDRWMPVASLEEFHAAGDGARWAGRFPVRQDARGEPDLDALPDDLDLPPLAGWYPIIGRSARPSSS